MSTWHTFTTDAQQMSNGPDVFFFSSGKNHIVINDLWTGMLLLSLSLHWSLNTKQGEKIYIYIFRCSKNSVTISTMIINHADIKEIQPRCPSWAASRRGVTPSSLSAPTLAPNLRASLLIPMMIKSCKHNNAWLLQKQKWYVVIYCQFFSTSISPSLNYNKLTRCFVQNRIAFLTPSDLATFNFVTKLQAGMICHHFL